MRLDGWLGGTMEFRIWLLTWFGFCIPGCGCLVAFGIGVGGCFPVLER